MRQQGYSAWTIKARITAINHVMIGSNHWTSDEAFSATTWNKAHHDYYGTGLTKIQMLGINFIKITLDLTQVDPWYFMYYINESNQFKHQLFINVTNSNMKRITGKQLAACQINLPVLSKQVLIGKFYQLKLKHDLLVNEENNLIKQLLCGLDEKGSK